MKFRLLCAAVILLLQVPFAYADNFPVTSNADAGSGTLREALILANEHPGLDSIKFSLPDTSVISRTIVVDSLLPPVIDAVVIDGISQSGAAFGSSLAKVQLTASSTLAYGIWLNADSSSVYGMFIQNFESGIRVTKSYNQIGAVTKGNVIFNCTSACISIQETDHVAMLSNIIGIDTAQLLGTNIGIGIQVDNSQAISIGGRSSEGRNIISGNVYGVNLISGKFVNMNANYIGTDITGSSAIPNAYGVYATLNNLNIEIGGDSLFESNLISGNTFAAIYGEFAFSAFQGNFIGVDRTGNIPLGNGTYGIFFGSGSNSNLIGGKLPYQPNRIAYNGNEAVYFADSTCDKNSLIRNITFCNSQSAGSGGFVLNGGNNGIVPPEILIANEDGVIGFAPPGHDVDVFVDDTCSHCEGNILVGSVTVPDNGMFEVLGNNITGNVTVTVTDPQGNTSEYAQCVAATSDTCIIPDFIVPSGEICGGTSFQLFDATITEPGSTITEWHWDFGDGTTGEDQNPMHTYPLGGEYMITLTVTNSEGCVKSVTHPIAIELAPLPAFFYTQPVCSSVEVQFTDESIVSEGDSIIEWHWNFADGGATGQQNPNHTYDLPGDYSVELTVTGLGCEVSTVQVVHVSESPVAAFTNPETACVGNTVLFEDQSTVGGGDEIVSWLWEFGDGNTSDAQQPEYAYSASGLYNLTLTVTSSAGCSWSQTGIILMLNLPEASFDFEQAGLSVTFTNTSSVNGAASYAWNFGDGNTSIEESPVHDYASGGVYEACLTVFDSTCNTSSVTCSTVDLPTGFSGAATEQLQMYPVPADHFLVIKGMAPSVFQISVTNMLGQQQSLLRVAGEEVILQTADWLPGIYEVVFHRTDGTVSGRKVLITH